MGYDDNEEFQSQYTLAEVMNRCLLEKIYVYPDGSFRMMTEQEWTIELIRRLNMLSNLSNPDEFLTTLINNAELQEQLEAYNKEI